MSSDTFKSPILGFSTRVALSVTAMDSRPTSKLLVRVAHDSSEERLRSGLRLELGSRTGQNDSCTLSMFLFVSKIVGGIDQET
jgi:hypothetical protein